MTESFDTIWEDILRCLRSRSGISTLARRQRNKIIAVNDDVIILESEKTGRKRTLKREEIRFVLERLWDRGTLRLEDLSPQLIGRRAIILAILYHCLPNVERVEERSSIRYFEQRQGSEIKSNIHTTEKKPISTSSLEAKVATEDRELKLKKTLNNLYNKYNSESYLSSSVLGIIRRFSYKEDIEVVGLIGASLAYGSVNQSRNALEKILRLMEGRPYEFILNFNRQKTKNILEFNYRYTKGKQMLELLKNIASVLHEYGSLENLFRKALSPADGDITKALINFCDRINIPFLIPSPKGGSACKRMCLFLRWMIRRDNVDCGIWDASSSLLIIPTDRHVARISYYIGLLDKLPNTPSWNDALTITKHLRRLDPHDPAKYDFAISRLGILKGCTHGKDRLVCKQCNLYEFCRFWSDRRNPNRNRFIKFDNISKKISRSWEIKVRGDPDSFLARIIIAGEWEGKQEEVKRLLEDICKKWPKGGSVKFVITCGGFIQFDWPESISRKDIGDNKYPNSKAIEALVKHAKKYAKFALGGGLDEKLRGVTDYITLGIDSYKTKISTTQSYINEPHIELVFLVDLRNNEFYWTGKSYPTPNQQSGLVRIPDLKTHFFDLDDIGKLMILGCHDLTIFNPRSKNAKGWREKTNKEFRKLAKQENPRVVLQHPHTTDSVLTWAAAWSGLKREIPSVKIYASAGRYYNPKGERSESNYVVKQTKCGNTIDFIVQTKKEE